MSETTFYFEILGFFSLLGGLIKTNSLPLLQKKKLCIYYVDITKFADWLIVPLLNYLGCKAEKLKFKLCDIKDANGELIRLRVHRKDLLEIQQKIIKSDTYRALYHVSWEQDRIKDYIYKGLVEKGITYEESVARVLFIIQVVNWYKENKQRDKLFFVIKKRPWFNIYKEYALKYGIQLLQVSEFSFFKKSSVLEIIRRYPLLYGMAKSIKPRRKLVKASKVTPGSEQKLYLEGRGDVNLENNGHNSDFFWQLNSQFPRKYILYKHCSDTEEQLLMQSGIYSVKEGAEWGGGYQRKYRRPEISGTNESRKAIQALLSKYDLERCYWSKFFNKHKVKVFLTWFKYTNQHMSLADAMKDNGGVSAIWQVAYDGYENAECKMNTDIVFSFSNFSHQIEKKLSSQFQYNVIAGYPKGYIAPLLKKEANNLRKKMQAKGAEKIIFTIDENSGDDSRWHTGHDLQRENYSYLLQKVLDTPWLGVIFKPKMAKTLRQRLGPVVELLKEAERTGRCYVYESSGRHTTSAPPMLAALSADICIHGHLSSGTAALECALEGLPTLLIDREGCPFSRLYELPKGKVIFSNWPDTIEAIMDHFKTPKGVPGFGDWSPILNEFDPFRDGLAANRMGTYLHWLMQGFEQHLDRETVMAQAAERYKLEWGEDKVLCM